MPVIRLEMWINADPQVVFDLSRSIDLHQISTSRTGEKAIGGRLSGLIELGEHVTWRAKHLGVVQKLTAHITAFNSPHYFSDEQVKGAFKSFKHEHLFEKQGEGTLMTDIFNYTSPLGILGRIADKLFLYEYMKRFLLERNETIKEYAEGEKGVSLLAIG